MNAADNAQTGQEIDELKKVLRTTWTTGNYDVFSRPMEMGAREFFDRLGVKPGMRLLDVGCGAGQLALLAARAGADVTACDIATNWLDQARARAASEGLAITFEEGDAESLPYPDRQFDFVVSLVGAMFAPRPELVAAELTRVCRPGGTIAMANWTPSGFVGRMFKTISTYIAPNRMPSPVLWGDEATVRQRLQAGIANVQCTRRMYRFEYPFPPDDVVEFFRVNYGPMNRAFASLDENGQANLRRELVGLWSAHNTSNHNSTTVDAEYLEVIATRAIPSRRAHLLADRIEEGANALATFAESLTEAEWRAPLSRDGGDRRSIGVIVHHVASVYPIEVDLARAIAAGTAVTEVTWDAVARLNAEHAEVNKSAALDLLLTNSRAAAAAVRSFTDEELDHAAPFSLSFGAPVTAQFVIEDHALRHSWHHLARIRTALGR
jgi:2-polyprenyl-3-methyl-5-hydroxy-6-metoxy-1,4-benzoquinol methylase